MAAEHDEKEWLGDYVVQFLTSPSWTAPINQFVFQHYLEFDLPSPEDNKLEYTELHNEFKNIIDSLLAAHLLDVDVTPEEFATVFETVSQSDTRLETVVAQLTSVDDFLVFKKMMIARYQAMTGNTGGVACPTQEPRQIISPETTPEAPVVHSGVVDAPAQEAVAQSTPVEDPVAPTEEVAAVEPPAPLAPPTPPAPPAIAPPPRRVPPQQISEPAAASQPSPADDLLPPMPDFGGGGLELGGLPQMGAKRASRIAAIVANATKAKTDDREKAALVKVSARFGA